MHFALSRETTRVVSVIINNGDCLAAGYKLNTNFFSATYGLDCSRHTNSRGLLYVHNKLRLIDGLQLSFFFRFSSFGLFFFFSSISEPLRNFTWRRTVVAPSFLHSPVPPNKGFPFQDHSEVQVKILSFCFDIMFASFSLHSIHSQNFHFIHPNAMLTK